MQTQDIHREIAWKATKLLSEGSVPRKVEVGRQQDAQLAADGITGTTLNSIVQEGEEPAFRAFGERYPVSSARPVTLQIQRVDREDWLSVTSDQTPPGT